MSRGVTGETERESFSFDGVAAVMNGRGTRGFQRGVGR